MRNLRERLEAIETARLQAPTQLDPEMLPNKQPLSTRLQEYARRTQEQAHARFSPGTAMDRFRDIPPALVLAVFDGDLAVVEPGGVGPLPFGHPIVAELLDCINSKYVTAGILQIVLAGSEGGRETDECTVSSHQMKRHVLYDGGLVVGVLDYRKTGSFTTAAAASSSTCSIPLQNQSLLAAMATQGVAPEMHKVYLRAQYSAVQACQLALMRHQDGGFQDAAEQQLLLALHPRLNTDPSTDNWELLEWALYDRDKVAVHCTAMLGPYPYVQEAARPRSGSASAKSEPAVQGSLPPLCKLKQLAAIDDFRARKRASSSEAFLGIDQRRNLARTRAAVPATLLNHPSQRVWRTVRFEREHHVAGHGGKQQPSRTHYSVNILSMPAGGFEVVLRCGSMPDTAHGPHGFTQRFLLPTHVAVEHYLIHLKHLFLIEDQQRRVLVDVANPSVLGPAAAPGRVLLQPSGHAATPRT